MVIYAIIGDPLPLSRWLFRLTCGRWEAVSYPTISCRVRLLLALAPVISLGGLKNTVTP